MVVNGDLTPEEQQEVNQKIEEFEKNPKKVKEAIATYNSAGCGAPQSGFNLMDLFVTKAHANGLVIKGGEFCVRAAIAIYAYFKGTQIRDDYNRDQISQEQNNTTYESRGKDRGPGERGQTRNSSGTNNPYKGWRQDPNDPNKVWKPENQTGKWTPKPKPADFPGRK